MKNLSVLRVEMQYKHPPIGAVFTSREVRRQLQFGTHTYCELYMDIQGSPVEMQTPTHWNLIIRGMTAPPPM
jgi:hypothetical protein